MTKTKNIFISYSHEDSHFVDKFSDDIIKLGGRVWIDTDHIGFGDSISRSIEAGIMEADYFFLVLSKKSLSRPWVEREYRAALTMQVQSAKNKPKIIPIKIDRINLPVFMLDIKYVDFTSNYKMPLRLLAKQINLPQKIAPYINTINLAGSNWPSAKKAMATIEIHNHYWIEIYYSLIKDSIMAKNELPKEWLTDAVKTIKTKIETNKLIDEWIPPKIIFADSIEMYYHNNPMTSEPPWVGIKDCESLFELIYKNIELVKRRELYVVPKVIKWDSEDLLGFEARGEFIFFQ